MIRFVHKFGFCLALCGALAFSQTTPEVASNDAPATFKARVNLVLVRVVVRDKKGRAVGNLTQQDFKLLDKGKPQTIVKFSMEKSGGAPKPAVVAETTSSEEPAAAPLPPSPERFLLYLFDDMHANFQDLVVARNAADAHLASGLTPADRAAVFSTSGQVMVDFTDDRQALHDALMRLQPRSRAKTMGTDCPSVSFYQADMIQNRNDTQAFEAAVQDAFVCANLRNPDDRATAENFARAAAMRAVSMGESDSQLALVGLKDAVRRISAMPGQRSIVLVSPGFYLTTSLRHDEMDVMDRAIRAGVTIGSLDARGLYTIIPGGDASTFNNGSVTGSILRSVYERQSYQADADVMAELADATGGTFFQNSNDLGEGFRRLAAAPEYYYILGFSPQNLKLDGSYHVLKVSVPKTSEGLSVQARRGYFAPKHEIDPAEAAKQEISEALFSRDELLDIPVEIHTQFFKSSDFEAKLAVVAHVDMKGIRFQKAEGRNRNTLTIVSALFDRNGNYVVGTTKTLEMRLKDPTLENVLKSGLNVKTSFDVTPGTYAVRLVVRDAEGQMMAARNGAVQIP